MANFDHNYFYFYTNCNIGLMEILELLVVVSCEPIVLSDQVSYLY